MLDFLLVLGQIPGTNIQVTYDEMVMAFLIFSVIYEYRLRRRAIRRFAKWAWYRLGVNYRKRKRMIRSFIKSKRYRVAVFERRIKRQVAYFFRRQVRTMQRFVRRRISLAKRQYYMQLVYNERALRRAKRSRTYQQIKGLKPIMIRSE